MMRVDLQQLIVPRSGFQSSVNIAYDMGEAVKVADFVPTRSALEVLEKLLLATAPKASERAHILIGAYGKGKSHLVLVLLSLLAQKHVQELEPLLVVMREFRPELASYVGEQIIGRMARPLVPVVIDGSQADLVQSLACFKNVKISFKTSLKKIC